jgi:hypothetical protein
LAPSERSAPPIQGTENDEEHRAPKSVTPKPLPGHRMVVIGAAQANSSV